MPTALPPTPPDRNVRHERAAELKRKEAERRAWAAVRAVLTMLATSIGDRSRATRERQKASGTSRRLENLERQGQAGLPTNVRGPRAARAVLAAIGKIMDATTNGDTTAERKAARRHVRIPHEDTPDRLAASLSVHVDKEKTAPSCWRLLAEHIPGVFTYTRGKAGYHLGPFLAFAEEYAMDHADTPGPIEPADLLASYVAYTASRQGAVSETNRTIFPQTASRHGTAADDEPDNFPICTQIRKPGSEAIQPGAGASLGRPLAHGPICSQGPGQLLAEAESTDWPVPGTRLVGAAPQGSDGNTPPPSVARRMARGQLMREAMEVENVLEYREVVVHPADVQAKARALRGPRGAGDTRQTRSVWERTIGTELKKITGLMDDLERGIPGRHNLYVAKALLATASFYADISFPRSKICLAQVDSTQARMLARDITRELKAGRLMSHGDADGRVVVAWFSQNPLLALLGLDEDKPDGKSMSQKMLASLSGWFRNHRGWVRSLGKDEATALHRRLNGRKRDGLLSPQELIWRMGSRWHDFEALCERGELKEGHPFEREIADLLKLKRDEHLPAAPAPDDDPPASDYQPDASDLDAAAEVFADLDAAAANEHPAAAGLGAPEWLAIDSASLSVPCTAPGVARDVLAQLFSTSSAPMPRKVSLF